MLAAAIPFAQRGNHTTCHEYIFRHYSVTTIFSSKEPRLCANLRACLSTERLILSFDHTYLVSVFEGAQFVPAAPACSSGPTVRSGYESKKSRR